MIVDHKYFFNNFSFKSFFGKWNNDLDSIYNRDIRITIHLYNILKKSCSKQYSIRKSLILIFYSLGAKIK
jgi:hypothetical protein